MRPLFSIYINIINDSVLMLHAALCIAFLFKWYGAYPALLLLLHFASFVLYLIFSVGQSSSSSQANELISILNDFIQEGKSSTEDQAYDKMWRLISSQYNNCASTANFQSSYPWYVAPSHASPMLLQRDPPVSSLVAQPPSNYWSKEAAVEQLSNILALMPLFQNSGRRHCNQQSLDRIDLIKHLKQVPSDSTVIFKGSIRAFWQREWGGSHKYKGVRKQGTKYSVKYKQRCVRNLQSAEEAAEMYDKLAIKDIGKRAKTNFEYTKVEVLRILNE